MVAALRRQSCVQGTNSDCGWKAPSLLTRLCLILPKLYWSDPHLSDSAFKMLWLISRPKLDCISRENSAEGGYVEPITPVHWAGKSGRAHGVRWWCSTVENAPSRFCARMIRSALAISRQGSGGADFSYVFLIDSIYCLLYLRACSKCSGASSTVLSPFPFLAGLTASCLLRLRRIAWCGGPSARFVI